MKKIIMLSLLFSFVGIQSSENTTTNEQKSVEQTTTSSDESQNKNFENNKAPEPNLSIRERIRNKLLEAKTAVYKNPAQSLAAAILLASFGYAMYKGSSLQFALNKYFDIKNKAAQTNTHFGDELTYLEEKYHKNSPQGKYLKNVKNKYENYKKTILNSDPHNHIEKIEDLYSKHTSNIALNKERSRKELHSILSEMDNNLLTEVEKNILKDGLLPKIPKNIANSQEYNEEKNFRDMLREDTRKEIVDQNKFNYKYPLDPTRGSFKNRLHFADTDSSNYKRPEGNYYRAYTPIKTVNYYENENEIL